MKPVIVQPVREPENELVLLVVTKFDNEEEYRAHYRLDVEAVLRCASDAAAALSGGDSTTAITLIGEALVRLVMHRSGGGA